MHIRLINPNTSAAMTASIGAAAQRIAAPATRLTAVRTAVRALADEHGLPQENLLQPAAQRALAWSVTDPESSISSKTGCVDETLTADTSGTMKCSAK